MYKSNVIINPIQPQAHRIVVKGAHAEIRREHFFLQAPLANSAEYKRIAKAPK
jgi:hypothetical protein